MVGDIWETKQSLDFPRVKFIQFRKVQKVRGLLSTSSLLSALVPEWGLPPEVIAPSAELPISPWTIPSLKISPFCLCLYNDLTPQARRIPLELGPSFKDRQPQQWALTLCKGGRTRG